MSHIDVISANVSQKFSDLTSLELNPNPYIGVIIVYYTFL